VLAIAADCTEWTEQLSLATVANALRDMRHGKKLPRDTYQRLLTESQVVGQFVDNMRSALPRLVNTSGFKSVLAGMRDILGAVHRARK
jgi:hypothetical protein